MTEDLVYIKDKSLDELRTFLESMGEKSFRAKQIFKWMYGSASAFSDMTNLSKDLRIKLEDNSKLFTLDIADIKKSKDGTQKFLFRTHDGEVIESVFMEYKYGNSICISSQAGCRMGCSFCASGLNGLSRNLTPGEMIDQLVLAQNSTGKEIRHIIFMGTGEPFDNYNNLKKAIENLCDDAGLGLSKRNITVSTCGLIPVIEEFADELPQVNLAISLHGSNDDVRVQIMPINSKYGVEDIVRTAKDYVQKTGRRITFEYAMINGLNDTSKDAEELAGLLRGVNCHVNLIPLNKVDEIAYKPTLRSDVEKFMSVLEDKHIQVTIRRELGADIDGACGQLRLKNI
jgi:23S rRNA (adenine2503-C2)-methyltransferase